MLDNWILPLTSLVIIILTIGILLAVNGPVLFPGETKLKCPKGYCSNNIYDGHKLCPPTSDGYVEYSPGYETCNPSDGCRIDSSAPCTYSNPSQGTLCPGDKDYTGVCSDQCPCLNRIYCPDFAQVYFQLIPEGVFVQNTVWRSSDNAPRSDRPLSLGLIHQTGYKTCGISTKNLSFLWPDQCLRGELIFNTADELWYCATPPFSCGSGQRPVRKLDGSFECRTFNM